MSGFKIFACKMEMRKRWWSSWMLALDAAAVVLSLVTYQLSGSHEIFIFRVWTSTDAQFADFIQHKFVGTLSSVPNFEVCIIASLFFSHRLYMPPSILGNNKYNQVMIFYKTKGCTVEHLLLDWLPRKCQKQNENLHQFSCF